MNKTHCVGLLGFWFVLSLSGVVGCQSAPQTAATNAGSASQQVKKGGGVSGVLPLEIARSRAAQVKAGPHYDLSLDLATGEAEFGGKVTIDFELMSVSSALRIDFAGGKVAKADLDGKSVEFKNDGQAVWIAQKDLSVGRHKLLIEFSHPYNSNGVGLHRFKDPQDQSSYVYTHFEPFDANQMFPCFDQPDLRATYKLQVTAPESWVVVGPTRESKITKAGNKKIWDFKRSENFATYLLSVHAGPFTVWSDNAGTIPLRLMVRKTLAQYVDSKFWFSVTRKGLAYYQSYFDRKYPFSKYDQVIVPEFNAGAMENVGAVTFSERFVNRGKPTYNDRESLASVVLHEMAHMWFGDLVTMRWWNDLWLNESFATYMSYLAMVEVPEFSKSAWLTFSLSSKQWAYWEDQNVTTHPIEQEVPSTQEAYSSFDGITYGKGASVLKQLSFFVGPQVFRDGVRAYLKKNAFSNAERKDFIAAIAAAAKKDLSGWTKEWLQTSGLNTVEPLIECKAGKVERLVLAQGFASGDAFARAHKTRIAGFRGAEKVFELDASYLSEKTEVVSARGKECPEFVIANSGDHDYAKLALKTESLAWVKKNLGRLSDGMHRSLLWGALNEALADGKLSVSSYVELMVSALAKEKEYKILTQVLLYPLRKPAFAPTFSNLIPTAGEPEAEKGAALRKKLEDFLWQRAVASPRGGDEQKLFWDSFVAYGASAEAMDRMSKALIVGEKHSGYTLGLALDQDRRWSVVIRLAILGYPAAELLIRSELARDGSDRGSKLALTALAAIPTDTNKQKWLEVLNDPDTNVGVPHLKQVLGGLFPRTQRNLRQKAGVDFYSSIENLSRKRDNVFLGAYVTGTVPTGCTLQSSSKIRDFVASHDALKPVVKKALKIAAQEDERCAKAAIF